MTGSKTNRVAGYDTARALAVYGMILINYKVVMAAETATPRFLSILINLFEGRAAATFVVLAGAGRSLMTRHARTSQDVHGLHAARVRLAKGSLNTARVGRKTRKC